MKMGLLKSTTKTETNSTIVPCNFTHSYASGQTGSGKTTAYIYPNLKERIKQGHGVLIYDYKGKEHLAVKALAKEAGRINDVVEIGVQWGKSINLLDNLRPAKLNAFLNEIYKMSKDNSYWEQSAINYVTGVFNVLWAQKELLASLVKADLEIEKEEYPLAFKSIASIFTEKKSIESFFETLGK
ncbi:MAG: hypothetical protein VBE63_27450, partial [Lamprobacter sp.]|uniref:hypothetical protein n=1 Tax=Lamprobacter sp. TaxID=3100796 RepID=UPI002B25CBCB